MKDFIDQYEDSRFPGLLELLFFLILIVDFLMAIWVSFMAPLHISKMPYLKIIYTIIIPIAFIAPLIITICIKKIKKHLILIINTYLGVRVIYLSFLFLNEIMYRLVEGSANINKETYSGIIYSGVFCIAFTFLFSLIWILLINGSKKIKNYISNL
jgi:hypothetical protein